MMASSYVDLLGMLPVTTNSFNSKSVKLPKSSLRWIRATQVLCAAQVCCGAVMLCASGVYLFGYSLWTGLMIGLLVATAGAVGVYGSVRGNRHMLFLHFVGILLGIVLSLQFLITVGRESEVDCALAELLVKTQVMENHISTNTDQILISAVSTKLQEMETLMDAIQENMVHTVALHDEQQRLKDWDLAYINSKLNVLQAHAEQVVHDIVKNNNLTEDGKIAVDHSMKAELERRLAIAQQVMLTIENHRESTSRNEPGLSFEMYEQLLSELTHSASSLLLNEHGEVLAGQIDISQLQKAHQELEHTKAALERQNVDLYHQMELGTAGERVAEIRQKHIEKRDVWAVRFQQQLEEYYRSQHHSMVDALDMAPQHCLVETKGRSTLIATNTLLLLLQAGSFYCVVSIVFGAALKKE